MHYRRAPMMHMLAVMVAGATLAVPADAQTMASGPAVGAFKIFGDWAVACDNIKSCGGAGLVEEDSSDVPHWLTLDLERKAGPTSPATLIATFNDDWKKEFPSISAVRFTSGGGDLLPFRMQGAHGQAEQSWRLTLTQDVVKKLENVTTIRMVDTDGKTLALGSVQGLNATMRYIDEIQGRAGGVTALLARGPKLGNSVPAPPATPFIRTAPRSNAAPATVTPAQIKQMQQRAQCDGDPDNGRRTVDRFRLDASTTLIAIPCGSGAYNVLTAYFIMRKGGQPLPAPLDHGTDWGETEVPILVNSGYDAPKQKLSHFAKGRGLGDCGSADSWAWDGRMFRLTQEITMGDCRGSRNWLRVWTANSGPIVRR